MGRPLGELGGGEDDANWMMRRSSSVGRVSKCRGWCVWGGCGSSTGAGGVAGGWDIGLGEIKL